MVPVCGSTGLLCAARGARGKKWGGFRRLAPLGSDWGWWAHVRLTWVRAEEVYVWRRVANAGRGWDFGMVWAISVEGRVANGPRMRAANGGGSR